MAQPYPPRPSSPVDLHTLEAWEREWKPLTIAELGQQIPKYQKDLQDLQQNDLFNAQRNLQNADRELSTKHLAAKNLPDAETNLESAADTANTALTDALTLQRLSFPHIDLLAKRVPDGTIDLSSIPDHTGPTDNTPLKNLAAQFNIAVQSFTDAQIVLAQAQAQENVNNIQSKITWANDRIVQAAWHIDAKVVDEENIKEAAIIVEQKATDYLQRPNAYENLKNSLSVINAQGASPAGTNFAPPTANVISEKENVDAIIKAVDTFESQYRNTIPANARAVWERRHERKVFYANLADKVRDNHQKVAESYAGLTEELREKKTWASAKEEVMEQIRKERDLHRIEYENDYHAKGFFERLKSRVTFQYTREWFRNRLRENQFRRTRETQKHYGEKLKEVQKEEKVASKARKNLRKHLDKVSRNALRK